jgi:hypothetical protein
VPDVYGGRSSSAAPAPTSPAPTATPSCTRSPALSVRLVRTFAPESYQSRVTHPKRIWDLTVDEGLLWFSEKGKRMWAYDLTSDGFFGASEFQQTSLILYKHVVGRERLFCWGTHDSDTTKHGLYRIAISGDARQRYSAPGRHVRLPAGACPEEALGQDRRPLPLRRRQRRRVLHRRRRDLGLRSSRGYTIDSERRPLVRHLRPLRHRRSSRNIRFRSSRRWEPPSPPSAS